MLRGLQTSDLVCSCIDELQRQLERKRENGKGSQSSSFSSFDPDDRPIPISEYLSNVACDFKRSCLNTLDMIVTTSPSMVKTVMSITSTTVSSVELSVSHSFSRFACRHVRVEDGSPQEGQLQLTGFSS